MSAPGAPPRRVRPAAAGASRSTQPRLGGGGPAAGRAGAREDVLRIVFEGLRPRERPGRPGASG
ncbi:hypothetical protein AB0C69_03545 [Actinomadura sp. NPDC048032]|uniref:hypothetical protein n=1 Tax=Actinomadura sp. NPDC048032 TaxID=3155747 RepID=UPI00340D818E